MAAKTKAQNTKQSKSGRMDKTRRIDKTGRMTGKVDKVGKITKSKTKLKQNSKGTKARINKLNMDIQNVQTLHSTLTKAGQAPKAVKALDTGSLRDGLRKDNENQEKNARAEHDLTAQLELLTGIEL